MACWFPGLFDLNRVHARTRTCARHTNSMASPFKAPHQADQQRTPDIQNFRRTAERSRHSHHDRQPQQDTREAGFSARPLKPSQRLSYTRSPRCTMCRRPFGKRNLWSVRARCRVLTCVRPLMRLSHAPQARMVFAGQVQIKAAC